MKVTVRIYGSLIPLLGRELILNLGEEACVKALSSKLSEKVGGSRPGYLGNLNLDKGELVILVNGRNIDTLDGLDTQLKDGDSVTLLPPFAGG